jgi:hypothetical protein
VGKPKSTAPSVSLRGGKNGCATTPKSGPSELGPYKVRGEQLRFGSWVECVKAAASLPHSKGMVYHLMAPQMVNERLND